jgi:hypothetical protein
VKTAGSLTANLFTREAAGHALTVGLCLWAVYAQRTYRVPGEVFFALLPWASGAVLLMSFAMFVRFLVIGPLPDGQSRSVPRWVERTGGIIVRLFVYYGLLIWVNGALDRSLLVEQDSEIVRIMGGEADFGLVVPYSWAELRSWQNPGKIERVLLTAQEMHDLWAGQRVVVQIRSGFLALPWVHAVQADEGKHYEAVLKLAPTAAEARKALVRFYAVHRRWPEARRAALEYFGMYPNDYVFAQQTGKAFAALARFDEMVAVLEPFVSRKPSYEVYNLVGFGLWRTGRKEEAIALLKASIPLDPDNWWAHYFLGYVYQSIGDYSESVSSFERVLKIRPSFPEVQIELARVQGLQAIQQRAAKTPTQQRR